MTDSQPLVCTFFQLPPSDQLFTRIHDIPWLVLLPQIEKLTYAMENLFGTSFSPPTMKTLIEAREVMGSKMLPLRDAILSSRDLSRHYVGFVDAAFRKRRFSSFVKDVYIFTVQEVAQKIEKAQQALSEFREELESAVSRIASLIGDNNHLSPFITESTQVISVMIPAIEECSALLQECNETFQNIYKQNFDPESFERNPPSDAEFQLVGEKWKVLLNCLHSISADWNTLDTCIANPDFNRLHSGTIITPVVWDATAVTDTPEDLVNSEALPERSPPAKVKIPFWRKLFQRVSTCFSSKPFH